MGYVQGKCLTHCIVSQVLEILLLKEEDTAKESLLAFAILEQRQCVKWFGALAFRSYLQGSSASSITNSAIQQRFSS